MANLHKPFSYVSIWQRLLAVFNQGGPQWGRPSNGQGNGDESTTSGSSQEEPPKDDSEGDQRPDQQDDDSSSLPPKEQKTDDKSPPDLDEIWHDINNRLGGLFGGGSGNKSSGQQNNSRGNNGGWGGGSGNRPNGSSRPPMNVSGKGLSMGVILIVLVVLLGWMATGLFTVQEGQRAVVLTFGKKVRTMGPGLSWHWPYPIQTHETVGMQQMRSINIGNSSINSITGLNNTSMLTQDKNILDLRFTVQYRIKDVEAFLFNNQDPETAVILAAESAVREVVGRSPMDVVIQRESCSTQKLTEEQLQERKNQIAELEASQLTETKKAWCIGTLQTSLSEPIKTSIQQQLNTLDAGIIIDNVNVLDVQVPDKVKPAFNEARSATAEKLSLINEGRAYANQRIASAQGVVSRLIEDSQAYKISVVAQATGDAQRFSQIYEQYRLAPEVTRNRMYAETMESIYSNVTKVMMDSNNSLLYLPLDRLLNLNSTEASSAPTSAAGVLPSATQSQNPDRRATSVQHSLPSNAQPLNGRSRGSLGRARVESR